MRVPEVLSALLVVVSLGTAVWAEDRQPVPDADKLKDAEKTVKDVFKADYAKTRPAERAEFAQKLLQQGMDTKDDATTRYILYREAAAQAAQAGDAATAMKALTEMGKAYNVDVLALKIDALAKAGGAAATADASKALAESYVALIDEAISSDNYDAAARATGPAESAARRAQDMPLVARVQARAKELRDLQGEFVKGKAAKQTLAEKADDPAANFAVGKYLCFLKGDWESGLPMLAKSSDIWFRAAAVKDIAAPTSPSDQAALADAWWDLAEKQTGTMKTRLQERARQYYEKALPNMTGFAQSKVKARLDGLRFVPAPQRTVDLLPLIDPTKDAVAGKWELRNGALIVSDKEELARLAIPYQPPEEYDFRIVFTRLTGNDVVLQILWKSQKAFEWAMGGFGNIVTGFEMIAGKRVDDNPTAVKVGLKNGQRYTSIVQVRNDGLRAFINGKLTAEWKTNYPDMDIHPAWSLHKAGMLGIAACNSTTIFHSVEVIEVTGQGKKTR